MTQTPDQLDALGQALTALVQESIRCMPETWGKCTLTIDCDGNRINYKLKNTDSSEKAAISDDLARLCEQYWTLFDQRGQPWLESAVDFFLVSGRWSFNATQKYPEQPAKLSMPSWKVWQWTDKNRDRTQRGTAALERRQRLLWAQS